MTPFQVFLWFWILWASINTRGVLTQQTIDSPVEPMARTNFTCPQVCSNTCNKRVECFAKDSAGNFSTTVLDNAKRKNLFNIELIQTRVLSAFDDHLSCYDAERYLTFFNKPGRKTLEQYVSYLQLFKDFRLEALIGSLSYNDTIFLCRQLLFLDCRVQIFFMRKVNFREFCERGVEQSQSITPTQDLIRKFLIDKYGEMKTWSLSIWETEILQYMDIMESDREFTEMFPPELMFKMLQMNPEACSNIPIKQTVKIIQDKLLQVLEQSKNDTNKTTEVVTLLQYCGGNIKDVSKYATKEQILNSFSTSNAVDISDRDKASMRNMLKESKSDPSQMTTDDIIKYASLILNDEKMLNSLNKTALEEAICGIGSQITDSNQARKLKSILETLDSYKDFTTYTKETIVCLKGLLAILSPSQLGDLPATPLGEALVEGSLKDVPFGCQGARVVLKKYNTYLEKEDGNLAANEILQLPGSIVICFGPYEIERLSVDALTLDVIKDFIFEYEQKGIQQGAESTIGKIIQKIMGDTTILSAVASSSWAKYIPSSLLRKSVNMGQQIADQLLAKEPITFKTDCQKSKLFYAQLARVIGPPSPDNFNWSATVFRSLQQTNILSGMPLDHLKKISDAQIFEVADAFLSSECISGNQKALIMEKFKAVQVISSSSITPEDIQKMDPTILFYQSVEDLQKYGESNKQALCLVLARISINEVPMNQVLEKAQFCSHCINAKSLSNENVTNCGALICALPEDKIDTMEAEALTEHAADLAVNCRWVQSQRQKLIDAIKQKNVIHSAEKMTDVDIMTIKTLIADMPPDDIALIPTDEFSLADTAVVKAFKAREELQKELALKGFMNSFTQDEWRKQAEGTSRVFKKIIEIKLAAAMGRRRRRATGTLTCDTLKILDTVGLPEVPVDILSNLADADFKDCLWILGQVTKWSSEQTVALALKMKAVYGIPSNWTSETISLAGTMLQGLNSSDIETLQLDTNSMSVLGQISGWSNEQEISGFKAFMSSVKDGAPVSSLGSDEMMALRNFLCGMTPSEIQSINASVYIDAADIVGGLLCCTEDQLKAWAVLAKDENGYGSNVSLWTVTRVSTVGIVIGGLSKDDISSFSLSQIDSIDAKYIPYIPVDTFSYFTAEQLGQFSQTQALTTTKEQRGALNCQQFTSLSKKAGITWDGTPCLSDSLGSTSTTVSMAMPLFLCVILVFVS